MDLKERIATHTWYHTIELAPGVVTPGYYDLRPILDRIPWPDVRGKRCLDVGTFDGFLAFELEKRGAAEVVALDVDDYRQLDWPARIRDTAPAELERQIGEERGRGFRIASEALGSRAKRVALNVYDLSPERVGTFDVVVCGSILTHLRDPILALERMRSVCSGVLLATEGIDIWLHVVHRRKPMLEVRGTRDQWTTTNGAGLRRMITVAGFRVERATRPYSLAYGPGRDQLVNWRTLLRWGRESPRVAAGNVGRAVLAKIIGGHSGPSHISVLARPEI